MQVETPLDQLILQLAKTAIGDEVTKLMYGDKCKIYNNTDFESDSEISAIKSFNSY